MLELKQGLAVDIRKGVKEWYVLTSDGNRYKTSCIVVSTGTFLRAKIFWGKRIIEAGRQGEIASRRLPLNLEKLGFRFGRLRIGTPPRVDRKTVDISRMKVQPYDEYPEMFSYGSKRDRRAQQENYVTYIGKECTGYILNNLVGSTAYNGSINHKESRYYPSIKDKILKFGSKRRYLVYVQPEGADTSEMYLYGLPMDFSEEVQMKILKRIKGLENSVVTRPGYGLEYDYLLPNQIKNSLESFKKEGIFFAGQINGTVGYEEAAAQGIIAGINAARKSRKIDSIIVNRQDGYIGVLIDDITAEGVGRPYRMLVSKNEYRFSHRHDNADKRMVKILQILGYKDKVGKIVEKYRKIEDAVGELNQSKLYKNKDIINKIKQQRLGSDEVLLIKNDFNLSDEEFDSVLISIRYENYTKE